MLPDSTRWNHALITSTFSYDEARKIVNIIIPQTPQSDKLVWFEDKSGVYSMKSGYKAFMETSNINDMERNLYKQIWSLHCPAKIKILLWKLVPNYVLTFQNFHHKRIKTENRCSRCQNFSESSAHVVRDCLFAKQVWSSLKYQWPTLITDSSFIEWMS